MINSTAIEEMANSAFLTILREKMAIAVVLCINYQLVTFRHMVANSIILSLIHNFQRVSIDSKKNVRELWPPQDEIDSMTGRSSFVVLCVVTTLYFGLGAVMYKSWEEDWSYLDAIYFIFVSTR